MDTGREKSEKQARRGQAHKSRGKGELSHGSDTRRGVSRKKRGKKSVGVETTSKFRR